MPSQLFLEGYDVWLGNARGTMYSREHNKFDADEDAAKYWDFSFAENGKYDLPAMIETIHANPDPENPCMKITYVGHSAGTMSAFYGLAKAPYAYKYIGQFVALSPCFIANMNSEASDFDISQYRMIDAGLQFLGIRSLLGPKWLGQIFLICETLGEESDTC